MPFQVIPRELVFYDLLEAAARNVAEATGELVALIDEVPSVTLRVERIRELEHRGDDLTHEIISTLNQTFVVPLDRHDIHRLASALDDILDFEEGVAELIELLPIKEMFPGIADAGRCPGAGVRRRRARDQPSAVHRRPPTRCRGDQAGGARGGLVYRRAIAELYREDFHPLEVLMWKDLLHQVESAIDRCEDVAEPDRISGGQVPMTVAVLAIIAVALVFDFINGFHDAANSIATVVSTRVLTPRLAVAWAAFFNFVAFLVFGTKVAEHDLHRRRRPATFCERRHLRRAGRRHRLEPDHLVPRPADQLLPRPRRRHRRGRRRQRRDGASLISAGLQKIGVFIVLVAASRVPARHSRSWRSCSGRSTATGR